MIISNMQAHTGHLGRLRIHPAHNYFVINDEFSTYSKVASDIRVSLIINKASYCVHMTFI